MTAIVSIGFKTEPFLFKEGVSEQGDQGEAATQGAIPMFSHDQGPADLDRLIDTVRSGLAHRGHVLALYPEYAKEPALARLEIVRMALNTRHLVTYGTALPPLAGAALVSLASAVDPYVSATGVLTAALPHLENELLVLAWLGSVTKLSFPAPSLAQHVASLSPMTAFGVSYWPTPAVKTLSKKDRSVPLPTTFRPMMLATSSHEGDATWVDQVVVPGLGGPPVARFEPTPLGPRWWGTAKLVEAVAYPIDVPVTARRITQSLSPFLCRWCTEAVAARHCPFCGMDAAEGALAGGAA